MDHKNKHRTVTKSASVNTQTNGDGISYSRFGLCRQNLCFIWENLTSNSFSFVLTSMVQTMPILIFQPRAFNFFKLGEREKCKFDWTKQTHYMIQCTYYLTFQRIPVRLRLQVHVDIFSQYQNCLKPSVRLACSIFLSEAFKQH